MMCVEATYSTGIQTIVLYIIFCLIYHVCPQAIIPVDHYALLIAERASAADEIVDRVAQVTLKCIDELMREEVSRANMGNESEGIGAGNDARVQKAFLELGLRRRQAIEETFEKVSLLAHFDSHRFMSCRVDVLAMCVFHWRQLAQSYPLGPVLLYEDTRLCASMCICAPMSLL